MDREETVLTHVYAVSNYFPYKHLTSYLPAYPILYTVNIQNKIITIK